jgi:hypothetical protein
MPALLSSSSIAYPIRGWLRNMMLQQQRKKMTKAPLSTKEQQHQTARPLYYYNWILAAEYGKKKSHATSAVNVF